MRMQMKAALLFSILRFNQTKLHTRFRQTVSRSSELEDSLSSLRKKDFRFCLLSDQQGLSLFSPPIFPNPSILHKKPPRLKKKVKKKDSTAQTESLWHWFNSKGRGCLSAPLYLLHSSLSASQIYLSRPARKGPLPQSTTAGPGLMEGENTIVPCSCFSQDRKTQPQRIHFCSSAPLHNAAEKKPKNSRM